MVFLLHQCVRVFDHDRPRLRPREPRATQDEPIRVYVVVVHEPQIVSLAEVVPQSRVGAQTIRGAAVLKQDGGREVRIQRGLDSESCEMGGE